MKNQQETEGDESTRFERLIGSIGTSASLDLCSFQRSGCKYSYLLQYD